MRKYSLMIVICGLFLTQASFATMFGSDDPSSQHCDTIASACKNAGFTDDGTGDKSFWFSCMKPVLFNQTVAGVQVEAKDIKECRKAKIAKMKKELRELQAVR